MKNLIYLLSSFLVRFAANTLSFLFNFLLLFAPFAANTLCSLVENRGENHWKAPKRVLRYSGGTMYQTLTFRKTQVLGFLNFSDADWAGNIDNRRSISGFCSKLSESFGAISWGCKAQKDVATSNAEAKFNSVVETSKEAIHLRGILQDICLYCIK